MKTLRLPIKKKYFEQIGMELKQRSTESINLSGKKGCLIKSLTRFT